MKRKKRIEKGIVSLDRRIEEHKKKLEKAELENDEDLAGYYHKEILKLKEEKEKKLGKL